MSGKSSQEKRKVSILLMISSKTLKMAKRCNTSLKSRYVQHLLDSDLVCSEMFQRAERTSGMRIFRSVSFDNV